MNTQSACFARRLRWLFAVAPLFLAGCPYLDGGLPGAGEGELYDSGFDAGFAKDDEYWQGYWDSMDTVDAGEIFYSGADIPEYTTPPYTAGYWDGVWYAYNDGYFVAYDYAFTIGFSEGYDMTYSPDWLLFLSNDQHAEYLDGGFTDGYNDGFSEGRIVGAADYAEGLTFDWLAAMMEYRSGVDSQIEDLDLGTGEFGPVELYVYGTDPNTLIKQSETRRQPGGQPIPSVRGMMRSKTTEANPTGRPLTQEARTALDKLETQSPRGSRALTLETTWLQRIEAYEAAGNQ